MKYQKFIIKNYRAISEEIEIDLKKSSLLPIIGVNECGKTTILHCEILFHESQSYPRHALPEPQLFQSHYTSYIIPSSTRHPNSLPQQIQGQKE